MKTFLLSLTLVLVSACQPEVYHKPVVTGKRYRDFYNDNMPKDICRFWYQDCVGCVHQEFEDSCHFYHIGDTITSNF